MNRLKELRKQKKLSQKEIAKQLEFPLRTYQRMENGESQIKPDKAEKLADFFGVSVGYLLGYDEGQRRIYELFGTHPKKGEMGIVTLNELIESGELGFIEDIKILDELQTDTTVAIKFLESIQSKLLLFGSISKSYTNRIEEITSFLLDFYETAERRKNKINH